MARTLAKRQRFLFGIISDAHKLQLFYLQENGRGFPTMILYENL